MNIVGADAGGNHEQEIEAGMTTGTLTRAPQEALETTESYDRETGNLIYRSETPATPVPAGFSSDAGGKMSSPTIAALFEALAAAQGAIEHALKDTEGQTGHQTYSYATLGNVYDASRKHLREHGLSVTHRQRTIDGGVEVEAVLTHSSGEWLAGGVLFMPCALDAKAIGSALTYARRYTYSAIVGVAAEDDDGTVASESTPSGTATAKAKSSGKAKAKGSSSGGGKHGPLTDWRWGREKGTPLPLVSEKSLEWLIGQTHYGTDEDRAAAQAELDSRKAKLTPQAGDGEPAGEAPEPEAMSEDTRAALVSELVGAGLAPDEEAADALIDDKGDGTEAWASRQITLIRQRTNGAESADEPGGDE